MMTILPHCHIIISYRIYYLLYFAEVGLSPILLCIVLCIFAGIKKLPLQVMPSGFPSGPRTLYFTTTTEGRIKSANSVPTVTDSIKIQSRNYEPKEGKTYPTYYEKP